MLQRKVVSPLYCIKCGAMTWKKYGNVDNGADIVWTKFSASRDQDMHLSKGLRITTDLCSVPYITNFVERLAWACSQNRQRKVNHLFMDKYFKFHGEDFFPILNSFAYRTLTFNGDVWKDNFGLKRCGVLVQKKGKIKCDTIEGGYETERNDRLQILGGNV